MFLIKQLSHSRLLGMRLVIVNSYPTRAHGIIVNYNPSNMLNKELQGLGIYLKEYVLAESVVIFFTPAVALNASRDQNNSNPRVFWKIVEG